MIPPNIVPKLHSLRAACVACGIPIPSMSNEEEIKEAILNVLSIAPQILSADALEFHTKDVRTMKRYAES